MTDLIKIQTEPDADGVSRRGFIRTIVLTAASIVMIPAISHADDAPAAPTTSFVDVGPKSQFTSDWTRVVMPPDGKREVIFVRTTTVAATPFQAISARCTHRGCVVAFVAANKDFECPCHGGKFDVDGAVVSGPPKSSLNLLETKVTDKDTLMVEVPVFVPHHHLSQ